MTGLVLSRAQRQTVAELDRSGWRLTIDKAFVDGALALRAHHFRSFDHAHFTVRDDGTYSLDQLVRRAT